MSTLHVVKQGESLASIAAQYQISNWKTIYYDAANADFRQLRSNPHVIYPDDKIFIPQRQTREEDRPTNQRHKFVLKAQKIVLRIVVKDGDGDPLDNCAYKLEVAGKTYPGTTGSDGMIEEETPPDAQDGALTLWLDSQPSGPNVRWQLKIASLDPVEYTSGIQARLNNLGYDSGAVDGILGPRSKAAVRAFQEDNELTVDGIPGPRTRKKLKEVYGC